MSVDFSGIDQKKKKKNPGSAFKVIYHICTIVYLIYYIIQ